MFHFTECWFFFFSSLLAFVNCLSFSVLRHCEEPAAQFALDFNKQRYGAHASVANCNIDFGSNRNPHN